MAIDSDRWGQEIRDRLLALNPNTGLLNGTESGRLLVVWRAICEEHQTEINDFADIVLEEADILTLPGTFKDSHSITITGKGDNEAVTLEQKIV